MRPPGTAAEMRTELVEFASGANCHVPTGRSGTVEYCRLVLSQMEAVERAGAAWADVLPSAQRAWNAKLTPRLQRAVWASDPGWIGTRPTPGAAVSPLQQADVIVQA